MAKIRFNLMDFDGHVGISLSVRDVAGSDKPLFVQNLFALTAEQQAGPRTLMAYAVASLNDMFEEVARHIDIEATKKDPLA